MTEIALDDDHFCFACGDRNPDGLRIRFEYPEPGRCRAVLKLDRRFQGWRDILHGGIISTILDEGFAHAYGGPARGAGEAAVTAEMTVKFKKPVKIGQTVILEGRVLSAVGRLISCVSSLSDEGGAVLASATGKLIRAKKAQ
jgi:uncharacterized protein (TIGR00369 family)